MYRMIVIPLISFVICFSLFSCYEHDEKKIKRLVEEWTYKEIDFPSVPIFTKFARDTIMGYYERDCDYKILTYVDSIGCMRCHLSFSAWKPFIELLKDTCPSCNVLFFIHPMSRKNIEYLLTKATNSAGSSWCASPISCPSIRRSTTCWATSSRTRYTWRSSSTNTVRRWGWCRWKISSRRSWARFRTKAMPTRVSSRVSTRRVTSSTARATWAISNGCWGSTRRPLPT